MQEHKQIKQSDFKYKIPNYIFEIYNSLSRYNIDFGTPKLFNNLVISLGNGESLWKNIKIKKYRIIEKDYSILNLPLFTKKECYLFLNAPIDTLTFFCKHGLQLI